jgi:enterobactin synthetase component D
MRPVPNPHVGDTSTLLPPAVAQHTLELDLDAPLDLARAFPGIRLPPALAGAVRKRQIEFVAGRFCARAALRACAPECAEAPVHIGPNQEPLWPSGIVGAITHSSGFVCAAVARTVHARALGIDAERIMDRERANQVLDLIAARSEVSMIEAMTGWNTATVLTAIFSAKETVFKALYAEVGRRFDFRDAVAEAFDVRSATFRARLVTTLSPSLPMGFALSGRFRLDASFVRTALVLPP